MPTPAAPPTGGDPAAVVWAAVRGDGPPTRPGVDVHKYTQLLQNIGVDPPHATAGEVLRAWGRGIQQAACEGEFAEACKAYPILTATAAQHLQLRDAQEAVKVVQAELAASGAEVAAAAHQIAARARLIDKGDERLMNAVRKERAAQTALAPLVLRVPAPRRGPSAAVAAGVGAATPSLAAAAAPPLARPDPPETLTACGEAIAKLWLQKDGSVLDELVANLSSPANAAGLRRERLIAAAAGLYDLHGRAYPELAPMDLLCLHLYTLSAEDIDSLMGFDTAFAVPVGDVGGASANAKARGGEAFPTAGSAYRPRNPLISRAVNFAMKQAWEAVVQESAGVGASRSGPAPPPGPREVSPPAAAYARAAAAPTTGGGGSDVDVHASRTRHAATEESMGRSPSSLDPTLDLYATTTAPPSPSRRWSPSPTGGPDDATCPPPHHASVTDAVSGASSGSDGATDPPMARSASPTPPSTQPSTPSPLPPPLRALQKWVKTTVLLLSLSTLPLRNGAIDVAVGGGGGPPTPQQNTAASATSAPAGSSSTSAASSAPVQAVLAGLRGARFGDSMVSVGFMSGVDVAAAAATVRDTSLRQHTHDAPHDGVGDASGGGGGGGGGGDPSGPRATYGSRGLSPEPPASAAAPAPIPDGAASCASCDTASATTTSSAHFPPMTARPPPSVRVTITAQGCGIAFGGVAKYAGGAGASLFGGGSNPNTIGGGGDLFLLPPLSEFVVEEVIREGSGGHGGAGCGEGTDAPRGRGPLTPAHATAPAADMQCEFGRAASPSDTVDRRGAGVGVPACWTSQGTAAARKHSSRSLAGSTPPHCTAHVVLRWTGCLGERQLAQVCAGARRDAAAAVDRPVTICPPNAGGRDGHSGGHRAVEATPVAPVLLACREYDTTMAHADLTRRRANEAALKDSCTAARDAIAGKDRDVAAAEARLAELRAAVARQEAAVAALRDERCQLTRSAEEVEGRYQHARARADESASAVAAAQARADAVRPAATAYVAAAEQTLDDASVEVEVLRTRAGSAKKEYRTAKAQHAAACDRYASLEHQHQEAVAAVRALAARDLGPPGVPAAELVAQELRVQREWAQLRAHEVEHCTATRTLWGREAPVP